MSKRRAVVILLLSLTLVYPLTTHYAVQAYNSQYAATWEQYPEELQPYVDFGPFTGSIYGFLTILFGAIIAASWLLLFIWRK